MGKSLQLLDIGGKQVPLMISLESRKTLRVSFGRDVINIRIPSQMGRKIAKEQFDKAKQWIEQTFESKPMLLQEYVISRYEKRTITVLEDTYEIHLKKLGVKNGSIKVAESKCLLNLPENLEIFDESRLIKRLLSRGLSSKYLPIIKSEVERVNANYFKKTLNSVRLKYNKSNWGSCSSKGNINLSSRLLLVPKEVREYVIVHELAHLIEMNHSAKFWQIVEKVSPQYRVHEKWLDTKGINVDF